MRREAHRLVYGRPCSGASGALACSVIAGRKSNKATLANAPETHDSADSTGEAQRRKGHRIGSSLRRLMVA